MYRHITFLLIIFLSSTCLYAQNISGTWEGFMSDEFIQVNIEQRKNEICGYTYDYIIRRKNDHCKAKFEGYYNSELKTWFLSGTQFFENSGGHVLMKLQLWQDRGDYRVLKGTVRVKSFLSSFFGGDGDLVELRKVSNKPNKLPETISPCFPEKPKAQKIKDKKNDPEKPMLPNKQPIPPVEKDSASIILPKPSPPVAEKKDTGQLTKKMTTRKQTEQSRLIIDVDHINLKLYDNGIVDNDTVSVFYNGRLLVSHQRLSEKALELNIQLDEKTPVHEITLYAENLGGIPPNTALVVVTAGNQRYELHSKASLEENAVLVFEYRKKE